MIPDLNHYLAAGPCVDSDHPAVSALAHSLTDADASDIENTLALYYWVRDKIRYNPYALDMSPEAFRASTTLAAGEAWCVPKAILLAALCRAVGLPARLGYADVRNHLSTARLREQMNSDIFYFHGYCSHYLNGKWVKSTPAFNIELCDKFGFKPLEFDGVNDSLYHAFDCDGNRHMEYIRDRGEYAELPLEDMTAVFSEHYPSMLEPASALSPRQWDRDVASEIS